MGGLLLDGRKLAKRIEEDLTNHIKSNPRMFGKHRLVIIIVGEDPASKTYVKMKQKACLRIGLEAEVIYLPAETTTEELIGKINYLNQNEDVSGVMIQHPLPKHIEERKCFDEILPGKDVDGLTSENFGQISLNDNDLYCAPPAGPNFYKKKVKYNPNGKDGGMYKLPEGLQVFGSATPVGIMTLLKSYGITIKGMRAVVVGRGPILGKPMAMMLLNADATVTICHSKSQDLPYIIRRADIVVGALGKPEFIKADWIKDGAVVIDAGYNEGGVGDIEISDELKDRCLAYTPVPGGVGPMTIVTLLSNAVKAEENSNGVNACLGFY